MPYQPYDEEQNRAGGQPPRQPYDYGNPRDPGHPYQNGPRYSNAGRDSDFAKIFGGQNGQPFQFPWWAIVIGFASWWPLGFIFMGINSYLRNHGDAQQMGTDAARAAQKLEQQAKKAAEKLREKAAQAQNRQQNGTNIPYNEPPQAQNGPAQAQKQAEPAARPAAAYTASNAAATAKAAGKGGAGSDAAFVLAILGIVFAGVGALVGVEALVGALTSGAGLLPFLEDLVVGGLFMVGSVGMWVGAGRLRASRRIRRKIANLVGDADTMFIEDIAGAIPCNYEKCCNYLEDCIEKGVFDQGAYLDMRTRCLVVRGKAPAPAQQAQPTPETTGGAQYQATLQELERVNRAIPNAEMSGKIARLQAISEKIFEQAEHNPEKLPQMRRFMDYYLPTALKLLKTYAELDAQGIEGDNIRESKRRIEQVMDTMVTAFENQLDKLFQADAMDVSSDIDVMENMLKADGLAADSADPFDLYHKTAPQGPQPPTL
ncbi:MAG: 5-bromo-4-chloroindolyl phosphate hydrolysis family protein [Gemmiger sp.]|nr:5-bromo-4-chloroindolyl phosphate hydrolysis family protein [Gemmiger sp.]